MAQAITAVLLTVLLDAVAHGSRSPSQDYSKVDSNLAVYDKKVTRQTCSTQAVLPEDCSTVVTEIQEIFLSVDLDALNSLLNTLCTTDCISSIVEFYQCLNQPDVADFFEGVYCGQNDGQNCLVLFINGFVRGDVVSTTNCALDGNCGSSCRDWLQDTVDYLGCCSSSLYNNTASPYASLIPSSQFIICNVSLPGECPRYRVDAGANSGDDSNAGDHTNAGVVNHCGGGGLTMIAFLAIITALTCTILV